MQAIRASGYEVVALVLRESSDDGWLSQLFGKRCGITTIHTSLWKQTAGCSAKTHVGKICKSFLVFLQIWKCPEKKGLYRSVQKSLERQENERLSKVQQTSSTTSLIITLYPSQGGVTFEMHSREALLHHKLQRRQPSLGRGLVAHQ